ncbi:hypothetical protein ACHAPT_012354 [Fusarium lateritium]
MSFGWSAGDVFAAAKLLWSLYKALDEKEGAPEHYRRSASTLRSIQFRLRYLSKVVGEDENPDTLAETEEASLLETADKDDIRYVIVSLKASVKRLEDLVSKGCGMQLDPAKKKRRRDWPVQQINKLRWYTSNQEEVDGIIRHMFELTAPLSDLYLKINREEEEKEQAPLLYAGPELGIPPETATEEPGPTIDSALSHLTSIAHEVMSSGVQMKTMNLKVDHYVKGVFSKWFEGTISPRLWLHGDQAGTVSAIAYTAARDQRRPTIAFSGRHAAQGQLLTDEERLFRMVYSLLFQLLQHLEDISTLAVTGVDRPFTDLQLSIESMPLALKYMRYFLSLLPECIAVVDGWHFICNDAGDQVKQVLKSFLDLFEAPPGNDQDWYIRLLLTSPGNSPMLRALGRTYVHDFDLRGRLNTGSKLYTILLGMDW